MLCWYAIHVRSCCEKLVAERLTRDGFDVFYPHKVVKTSVRAGRNRVEREHERKFFPGYVFCRFDLAHSAPILQVPQVVHILGWGDQPAPIPDTEIEAVRTMVYSPAPDIAPCEFLNAGDLVSIESGPLRGLQGYVVFMPNNRARVVVSVTMLQQSVSAEVDASTVKLVKPKAA